MQFNPSYLQYDLLQGHHRCKDSHLIFPLHAIPFCSHWFGIFCLMFTWAVQKIKISYLVEFQSTRRQIEKRCAPLQPSISDLSLRAVAKSEQWHCALRSKQLINECERVVHDNINISSGKTSSLWSSLVSAAHIYPPKWKLSRPCIISAIVPSSAQICTLKSDSPCM